MPQAGQGKSWVGQVLWTQHQGASSAGQAQLGEEASERGGESQSPDGAGDQVLVRIMGLWIKSHLCILLAV